LSGQFALAFVLVYKATRVVNIAIGEMLMIGAYLFFALAASFSLPIWLAVLGSVLGTGLLGAVIEAADGKPLAASMHERLFSQLDLTATAMDDAADIVSGRASGYTNTTGPVGFDNASFLSMTYPGAAGAMRSTTTDLCRWHQALLGGRVLSSSSLAKMLTPATLADGTLPKDGDAEVRYGFGLQLSPADTREVISHGGGINGFASYLGTYREADLSLATIVNTDGGFIGGPGVGPRVQAIRGLIRDSLLTV